MSRQQFHAEEMEAAFTEEEKKIHNPYFREFNSYLIGLPEKGKLIPIDDEGLYQKFTDALLNENPKSNYVHQPWRYFFYYNLFKISPTWLRDYLVEKFMKFPKYKASQD